MKLHDVATAPWAITPEMFVEVQGIYARHLRGEKIDLKALEARIGAPLPGPTRGYDVQDGVAILPVDGVLAKRMNLLTAISGGTSMQMLGDDFRAALADPLVDSIILVVDSPGGTVDGTQELSDLIYGARTQKPIVALADGTMASAAYWVGSAASRVFASSDTTQVGSIGVVAVHRDVSGAETAAGVKTTEIAAGKYKRIASSYAPLSAEGRQSIQDQVDYTYSVFVGDVARNRGTTADAVVAGMADGQIFLGQQAVDAGLVDGIATLDQLVARAAAGEFSATSAEPANPLALAGVPALSGNATPGAAAVESEQPSKESVMDVNTLKETHPAVAAALIEEGRIAGEAAGAAAERTRIQAVEAQSMPGHESLIAALKFDGKTTGPEAAMQVLSAEKIKRTKTLDNLKSDADAANVRHAAAPEPGDEDEDEDEADDSDGDASASPSGGQPKKKAGGGIKTMVQAGRVAERAREYIAAQAKNGVRVSAAQAVAHVTSN